MTKTQEQERTQLQQITQSVIVELNVIEVEMLKKSVEIAELARSARDRRVLLQDQYKRLGVGEKN